MQINFNVFLIEKKKFDSDVLVKYIVSRIHCLNK